METKSVFISSCSRRELARRRPNRLLMRVQSELAMVLLVAAVVAFLVVRLSL